MHALFAGQLRSLFQTAFRDNPITRTLPNVSAMLLPLVLILLFEVTLIRLVLEVTEYKINYLSGKENSAFCELAREYNVSDENMQH